MFGRNVRRLYLAASLVATAVVCALVGFWWLDYDGRPLLKPAPVSIDAPEVLVGPNVQVSKPHGTISFTECIIAADPNQANRLFASSMCWRHRDGQSLFGYLSEDGGTTWATSLELLADQAKSERLCDPTAVFGPDGALYFVHMRNSTPNGAARVFLGQEAPGHSLDWLCLPAGATTWEARGRIGRFIDRPWLAVDGSNGVHRGRLYCTANISRPYFITSADGGRTFQFPTVPCAPKVDGCPAQPVVFSDGSLLTVFRCSRDRQFNWSRKLSRPSAPPTAGKV
jgi:hypothetical protein